MEDKILSRIASGKVGIEVNNKEPQKINFKIKVTYEIPQRINTAMDTAIIKKIESIGGKWYAQGMDMCTGIRDICFDVKCL